MALRIHTRRWVSLRYLLLLVLLGGLLLGRIPTSEGNILLSPGSTEHTVVMAHNPDHLSTAPHRNLRVDQLPLDNPRALQLLDKSRRYDAIVMPLGLRLDRYELLEQADDIHELHIQAPGDAVTRQVVPGDSLSIGDSVLRIEKVVPWEGLLRHERGRPMAHLVWAAGPNQSGSALFLERDTWYYPDGQTALQFQWHDTRAEAQRAASAGREALETEAQWGVREGGAIQWLQSFTPGSGLTLRDGTQVLLVRREADGSAITLQVTKGEKTTRQIVSRDAVGGPGPYYYQDPAGARRVLRLHGWDEGQVIRQYLEGTSPAHYQTWVEGEQWHVPQGDSVYLAQVMSNGVPVTHSAGGLWALVAQHGEDTLQIREGVVITSGALRLEYRRLPQPPDVRLHLTAWNAAGKEQADFALNPGESKRLGSWTFTWAGEHVGEGEEVVLTARRRSVAWTAAMGIGLIVSGFLGLVFLQTRRRAG